MRNRSFSVIIPTYGRDKELFAFIDSVLMQEYKLQLIELIIVDQNDVINIKDTLSHYYRKINIKYIHTSIKGIANAKNIGIQNAYNDIITFADDDSKYYPDTLAQVNQYLEAHPDVDFIYGKVFDRVTGENLIRNWKSNDVKLNKFNYHFNYIAIACFTKIKSLDFDIRFGVGSNYGMGEELDYLLRSMNAPYNVWFTPKIEVWHPEVNVFNMPYSKIYSYAKGYGAICKKHISLAMLWNLWVSSSYQAIMAVYLFLTGKLDASRRRYLALTGRINGFIQFRK